MGQLPPSPSESMRRVAKALFDRTVAGKLTWAAAGADRFIYANPNSSVTIESIDGDGQAPYRLSIYDTEGNVQASLVADHSSSPEEIMALADLYELVRRQVLNIEPIVESFLRGLPS